MGSGAAIAAVTALGLAQIKIIQEQPEPPPPAGLKEGGFISGAGTEDTIPAQLTPGEFVIDRDRTSLLLSALDENLSGSTQTINLNVEAGAFTFEDADKESIVEEVAEALAEKVENLV